MQITLAAHVETLKAAGCPDILLISHTILKCSQRVKKTRLEDLPSMAEALFRPHQRNTHLKEILAAKVFQFAAFEQVPDILLRVQVRSITGKTLQMEALGCACREELLDSLGAVDRRAIPNHQELASDFVQQHA